MSAGLLLYRHGADGSVEVLLVHPGGPFWSKKDAGAWSIPKGEYGEGDDPAARAEEEFAEELGQRAPPGPRVDLGEVRQAGGKRVRAWAVRGDLDARATTSNVFEMEWPPRSGELRTFPEVDKAAWYSLPEARTKLLAGQLPLLERLESITRADGRPGQTGQAG
ncbi:MAG TPA: NUDIX domain-containing protein [Acidimicrobiales bacterium]|nr:NUDIX domain-containing protein [Acidimicrobiales bacterium]